MDPSQARSLLPGGELTEAWRGNVAWRILDTNFGDGSHFFAAWQAWAETEQGSACGRMLHYVAIAPTAPQRGLVMRCMAGFPALAGHADELGRHWFGLLPGFHRLVLQHGRLHLTLCIGPLHAMLREQRFVADSVFLNLQDEVGAAACWDAWCIKALTRLCRAGTGISATNSAAALRGALVQAGFTLEDCAPPDNSAGLGSDMVHRLRGAYRPHSKAGAVRHQWRLAPPPVSTCIVIGAGLAGATVAAALARRGWQTTVLDAAAEPAAGASGLPLGVFAPQLSRDDSTRSRLSRAGIRLTLQLCHHLLSAPSPGFARPPEGVQENLATAPRFLVRPGEDWSWSGILELRHDKSPGLPDNWPEQGSQWSAAQPLNYAASPWGDGIDHGLAAVWHAVGGWIKPARLVRACLAQHGVRFVGNSRVESIGHEAGQWVVRNPDGIELGRAPQLVVAAALDSVRLLNTTSAQVQVQSGAEAIRLAPMAAQNGQVSWALQREGDAKWLPPFPVNGLGSFVSGVPMDGAAAWFAGASYESGVEANTRITDAHGDNLGRLRQLLPATAGALADRFGAGDVHAWRGTRCVSVDRLPVAGTLDGSAQPSLWVSTAMGSRGLTYAVLCAELLAAQLCAEPLPLEASLVKCISATRRRLLHHL